MRRSLDPQEARKIDTSKNSSDAEKKLQMMKELEKEYFKKNKLVKVKITNGVVYTTRPQDYKGL